MTNISFSGTEP